MQPHTAKLITITPNAEHLIGYCARVSSPNRQDLPSDRLLRYCIRHSHWSPFEMAHMVVEITTTRAISAQILRHRSFSFQEFSQRYAEVTQRPDFPEMRLAGTTNRQSSFEMNDAQTTPAIKELLEDAADVVDSAWHVYNRLIANGIATETARFILPLCAGTRLYMTGSIRSWLHYVQIRATQDTQKEHRLIAESIQEILKEQVPNIYEAFLKYHSDGDQR